MNNHRPWRNGLTEPGILDEPLDDPALQRDSARALLDEATARIEGLEVLLREIQGELVREHTGAALDLIASEIGDSR